MSSISSNGASWRSRYVPKRLVFLTLTIPFIWLVAAGVGLWHFAGLEREPPVFDALSYAQKAQAFWHAIAEGHLFNPLRIQPDIRPFGAVFFTYPIGFHYTFRGFYFLTNFLPIVLIYLAIYNIFRPLKDRCDAEIYAFAILLVAVTTLPPVFQFALAPNVDVMGTWGYIDLVFGALAGLSVSFLVRTKNDTYFFDIVCATCIAIVTIFVKPTGMVVMAAVYGSAMFISAVRVKQGNVKPLLAAYALLCATILNLITAAVVYKSAYFSPANIAYGESSLRLLHQNSQILNQWRQILGKVWVSFGPSFIVFFVIGLIGSFSRKSWYLAILALAATMGGTYLWLGRTSPEVARYFFPFPVMAAMFVMPSMLRTVTPRSHSGRLILLLGIIPASLIALCLYMPKAFPRLEGALGINLSVNVNPDAVAQAELLSRTIGAEPKRSFIVYYVGESADVRAFEAVMDWRRVFDLAGGNSNPALPIDWVREAAYRFNEMIRADFIVFRPVENAKTYLGEHTSAQNYDQEEMLIRAWLTTLTPGDGVDFWRKGSTDVLVVTDRAKLWASMERIVAGREWPKPFTDGFTHYGVVNSNHFSEVPGNLVSEPIQLFDRGIHVADIVAVTHKQVNDQDRFAVYVRQLDKLDESDGAWSVFVHRIGVHDEFTGVNITYLSDSADKDQIVIYKLDMKAIPISRQKELAVGIFRPIDAKHADNLINHGTGTDWDGRRTILPAMGRGEKHLLQ